MTEKEKSEQPEPGHEDRFVILSEWPEDVFADNDEVKPNPVPEKYTTEWSGAF